VSLQQGRKVPRALAVVLLCLACDRATAEEPAPPQSIEELRSRIQRELDGANLPGIGIAIVLGGEVVYAGGVGASRRSMPTSRTDDAGWVVLFNS
jgi:CubicO group peptidase (beta-lactamase class C family)